MNATSDQLNLTSEFLSSALGAALGFAAAFLLYLITRRIESRSHMRGLISGVLFELEENLRNIESIHHPGRPSPGTYYTHYGTRTSTIVYRTLLANPLFLDLPNEARIALQLAYKRIAYLHEMDRVVQMLSVRPESVAQIRASTQGDAIHGSIPVMKDEIQPAIDALRSELARYGGSSAA